MGRQTILASVKTRLPELALPLSSSGFPKAASISFSKAFSLHPFFALLLIEVVSNYTFD